MGNDATCKYARPYCQLSETFVMFVRIPDPPRLLIPTSCIQSCSERSATS